MISIRNLRKSFGTNVVIDDIDLDIYDGERLCVIGKSGTGKSVLVKLIIGLLEKDDGEIFIDGLNTKEFSENDWDKVRVNFGYVFQGSALFDSLTILENVGIALYEEGKMKPKEISEHVTSTLAKVGLNNIENKYPDELSGGMRKRVAVARALITNPRYIIYDEPTTGLDPVNSDNIDNLIASISSRNEKVTSIIITHDIVTVEKIANRVIFLERGRIAFDGTPGDMKHSKNQDLQMFINRNLPVRK
ncbi:MAG: hypothetical protein A3G23_04415 [Bacteroidetes bacterium RIFCSPLOWO2_12_FULL_37_12]|nr:MAG: hypothetical protein A3G23_04415 [Bacteroidetes bacterium RIFCSPLOWO2_12_FULL_37_12]